MSSNSKRKYRQDPIISCCVDECKNTVIMNTDKHFFRIPDKNKVEWCDALNRREAKGSLYICEDHLNLEEDLTNYQSWHTKNVRGRLKVQVPERLKSNFFTNTENTVTTNIPSTSIQNIKKSFVGPRVRSTSRAIQQVDVGKNFSRESTSHCELYGNGTTSFDPLKDENPDILDEETGDGDVISVEHIKTEEVGEEETTLVENYDDVYSFGEYVASLLEELPRHLCKTAEDDIVTLIKNVIDNYQTQEKNQTSIADHSSYFNANKENVAIEYNSQLIDTPLSPSISNVEENMMENNLCDDISDDEEYVNNDENNLKRKYSDINTPGESKSTEKLELGGESLPELRQGKVARIPGTDTKKDEEVNAVNTTLIENYDDIYSFGEYVASLLEKLPRQHCKTLQNDIVCLIKNVNVNYQTNKKGNTGSKENEEHIGR